MPGVGHEAQGAGVAFVRLDDNPRPEMILMAYDNPAGENNFRYKVGWNVKTNGQASSWNNYYVQVSGVVHEAQGAGVAFEQIDKNLRPEIILLAYDNPAGENNFRYRMGWNFQQEISFEDSDKEFVGYVSDEESRFKGYVSSFKNEFGSTWPCRHYLWGKSHFLGNQHLSYADSADLAYIAGHGSPSRIIMSKDQDCVLENCAWGSYSSSSRKGDLEYIVFHSCSVLKMNSEWSDAWRSYSPTENPNPDWRDRWRHFSWTKHRKRPFSGLHMAMGFRTKHKNGSGAGRWAADEFAENLKDGYPVRYAWYEAAEDARFLTGWKENKAAVFYIRPHKDENIHDCNSRDYRYGDPEYLLDVYYMK